MRQLMAKKEGEVKIISISHVKRLRFPSSIDNLGLELYIKNLDEINKMITKCIEKDNTKPDSSAK